MKYIIGIDTGTSNTKAIAFSIQGSIIAEASFAYQALPATGYGYNEQDPELLFNAMIRVLKEVKLSITEHELLGISFSCAMHSVIAVNDNGIPLTNAITWADLRSNEYAKRLKDTTVGIEIYNRTGTPVHPMSPFCKIQWIRDHLPEVFAQTSKFISIKEYFFFKLFGRFIIDYSIASATGMFNIQICTWDEQALEVAGISTKQLSIPVSTTHIVRGLIDEYVHITGISKDMPFIIGASDGCLANLGSNALNLGDVSLTIGTSGAVRMIGSSPQADERRRLFNYILSEGLYVSGGPINNGGILLKWYAENFLNRPFNDATDFEWFVREASTVGAGCDGLIFLPYVQGERAPVWDASAKGVFFGIHAGHTQTHFMRAIVEGICYSLYQVAGSIEDTIGPIKNIYASGGFIRSGEWLQMIADVFNKPVKVMKTSDASAVGAAILGLYAMEILKNLSEASSFFSVGETIFPDKQNHICYDKNFRIYDTLYDRLKDAFV